MQTLTRPLFDSHGNLDFPGRGKAVIDALTTVPAYVPTHPVALRPLRAGGEAPAPVVPAPVEPPAPVVPDAPDFSTLTREALRDEAKRLGVPGMGRMLKDDLIAAVAAAHKALAA